MERRTGRAGEVALGNLEKFRLGHEQELLRILAEAHRGFYDRQTTMLLLGSRRFDPDGCFVAEENGSPVGFVAVTRLPRENWRVLRYLAVEDALARVDIAKSLLASAVQYARSQGVDFLRASTPAMEPYVSAYKESHFSPLRMDFRISWDLTGEPELHDNTGIGELSSDVMEKATKAYVESLSPFWDWRTDEQGGNDAVAKSFVDNVKAGERWLVCSMDDKIVGLAGLLPDYYEPGAARFRGASVIPEYRGRLIGTRLMDGVKGFARRLGQRKMTVYTFSYLDCLAPGALLYLKTGGKIEAEYVQLELDKAVLSRELSGV